MPELSILIPTYNCAHFLPQALDSVLRQGLQDFEIVVSDNASEDNTEEVLQALRIPQLRYYRNTTNLGSRENGNRCMAYAQGTYVKLLCADDVLLEGVLQEQLEILRSRQDVSLVTSDLYVTDEQLHREEIWRFFPGSHTGARVIGACVAGLQNYIGGPSNIMFRRAAAEGIRVDPTYNLLSDLKFEMQLLQRGNYVNIDRPGYLYRRHSGSDTSNNCPPGSHLREFKRLVEEFGSWNPLNCLQGLRKRATIGESPSSRDWWEALAPLHVLDAVVYAPDVLRLRKRNRRLAAIGKE